jgi:hypothetical protein
LSFDLTPRPAKYHVSVSAPEGGHFENHIHNINMFGEGINHLRGMEIGIPCLLGRISGVKELH